MCLLLTSQPGAGRAAPSLFGSATWNFWCSRKQRGPKDCRMLGAVLNAAGWKSNANPRPASREARRKDPVGTGGEAHRQCPALLLPPPYGHGGKAIATVDPRQYALILPTSLVLDLSVLENVIDSLAPAASPPARKGHGACRSPGAHAASLILRHVQAASLLEPWFVTLVNAPRPEEATLRVALF